MAAQRDRPIRTDIPHSARIWNYWLGGRDFYEIDRLAGEAGAEVYPDIRLMARSSRLFLARAVRYLAAEAGVRQFLDVGTGLPTMQNTHEIAQREAPESRIVYVDNDPLVIAHARAVLVNTTDAGVTTYLEADFNEPEQIVERSREVLDLTRPVAVLLVGVLGHASSYAEARRVVAALMGAVPPGSHLVYYDGSTDDETYVRMCANYARTGGVPYHPRSSEEIRGIFDGLELLAPGVAPINHWRATETELAAPALSAWGGVARKPAS